jgi:hypothetical protein
VLIKLLDSIFSIVGIQRLGKDSRVHENFCLVADLICSKLDEEWIEQALSDALGGKKPDWDHASLGTSLSHNLNTDDDSLSCL